ncbi:hypothetical protein CHH91_09775 [Virgibacillus sp. 7505]|uniref:hypothetical protein n=1 Tax=Virgibacillus sp. 7505 TaxID=2022548 RepID=UPI000BA51B24|nr:hypothetical protein [Virgibacillus sp. 7505]PAE15927.1 hypothetical protein CHH91_09775 [Virgibacillus sp. 7505]
MLTKTIRFLIIFLLLTGVTVLIFAAFKPFKQDALIEDTIRQIEVYAPEATKSSVTVTDKERIDSILKCINTCKREEMSPEASYQALDATLILYGAEDNYEVGVWQEGSTVSFVYDGTIIGSEFEPFPL